MDLYFDFHLHSCLSPCADDDMTPANLAAMCALAGLGAVALTDHNTTGNCAAFAEACSRHGLLCLPGMELTTAEEVHVICLLPDLDAADAFGRLVRSRQPHVENNPRIFGNQIYMDSQDGVLGRESRLLLTAAAIGVDEVSALVNSFGGVAFPAHIDRPSFSLYSNLGVWEPSFGFPLAECSPACRREFLDAHPELSCVPLITGSDAHRLDQVLSAAHRISLSQPTPRRLLDCLRQGMLFSRPFF